MRTFLPPFYIYISEWTWFAIDANWTLDMDNGRWYPTRSWESYVHWTSSQCVFPYEVQWLSHFYGRVRLPLGSRTLVKRFISLIFAPVEQPDQTAEMAGRCYKTTSPQSAKLLLRRTLDMSEQTSNVTSRNSAKAFSQYVSHFEFGRLPEHNTYCACTYLYGFGLVM